MFNAKKIFLCVMLAISTEGMVFGNLAEPAQEGAGLTFSHVEVPGLSHRDGSGIYDQMVREVCRKAGVTCKFLFFEENARSLIEANQGNVDGTYPRISAIEQRFSNLVKVPEFIGIRHFVAFVHKGGPNTIDWSQACDLVPAFPHGWQRLHQEFDHCPQHLVAPNPVRLFQVLLQEKVGIVVYSLKSGRSILSDLGVPGIRVLHPPLDERKIFIYLHRRHTKITQDLAKALQEMKLMEYYSTFFTQEGNKRL